MNWASLEECDEPIEVSVDDFDGETLESLPAGVVLQLWESNWPELYVSRDGDELVVELSEHIYTKFWSHKYHARVFCEAMLRAVRRLSAEGAPIENAQLDDEDDVHLFVRWKMRVPSETAGREVIEAAKSTFDAVWERANAILDNSDSVLVLGKDTDEHLETLVQVKEVLEDAGFYVYIIKEQPDRLGESVLQKVLRYALSSRFVIVENTDPSGHLYEFSHVAKMAECTVAVLQKSGAGSTWMFEDAYFRHNHWQKFEYDEGSIAESISNAIEWAQNFNAEFGEYQKLVLPWMK